MGEKDRAFTAIELLSVVASPPRCHLHLYVGTVETNATRAFIGGPADCRCDWSDGLDLHSDRHQWRME